MESRTPGTENATHRHQGTAMESDIVKRQAAADSADLLESMIATDDTSADHVDESRESIIPKAAIVETAKHLGKTTIKAGAKLVHMVEERIQDIQQNRDPHPANRARYMAGAGAIALAGGLKLAAKKRHEYQASQFTGPKKVMIKAKELIPSR